MRKIEEPIDKVAAEKKDVFLKMILSMKDDLYRIAKHILKDDEDIQDAIQMTMINSYNGMHELKDFKHFRSWVFKILTNECRKIYRSNKKDFYLRKKFEKNLDLKENYEEDFDAHLSFDNLLEALNEREKVIFNLYYDEKLTIKQISKMLNTNENTIKYMLCAGRKKVKKHLISMLVIILCILLVGSVTAFSFIPYLKRLFKISYNDNILTAIENLDWYQEIDMDYIDLGDGYKIKLEYILVDEMSLYMVFDFTSESDLGKFDDLSIIHLNITTENGDVICNTPNLNVPQYMIKSGGKSIEHDKHHIKALEFIMTNGFPKCKTLNINFKKVVPHYISYFGDEKKVIDKECNIKVDLSDKFVNRTCTYYTSDSPIIKKALVTETGFYAIFIPDSNLSYDVKLIDENENMYLCHSAPFFMSNDNSYLAVSAFNISDNNVLKLVIDDEEYTLIKHSN